MGSDQDENRRYEAIDALRAIAVMLVLIFHYTSRFPADYIGVRPPDDAAMARDSWRLSLFHYQWLLHRDDSRAV
ncbi:hypothetical protein AB4Z43_13905 [Mesorhizobium sp. 2RAF45]|uniref:hypothetical protein n=1 Tax=Mesorhizobium sp. 2RAF45 TaxID=3233001 RepID=UPI003F9DFCE8